MPDTSTQSKPGRTAYASADCVVVPLYHERFHAAALPSVQGLRFHPTPPQVRYESLWLAPDA